MTLLQVNGYLLCDESTCDDTTPYRQGQRHYWCNDIADAIAQGKDAEFISSDERVNVPVAATADIWAVIYLDGANMLQNGACSMYLEYQPDLGRQRSEYLGYWNPGEGRDAMKRVIFDWWKAQVDPTETWINGPIKTRCPASVHGLKQSKQLQKITSGDERLKCLWNIVMEKACTPCIDASGGLPDPSVPF